jgi:hypothetical protein
MTDKILKFSMAYKREIREFTSANFYLIEDNFLDHVFKSFLNNLNFEVILFVASA